MYTSLKYSQTKMSESQDMTVIIEPGGCSKSQERFKGEVREDQEDDLCRQTVETAGHVGCGRYW